MSDLVSGISQAKESVNSMLSGLKGIGAIDEKMLGALNIATGSLQAITGTAQLIHVAKGLMEMKSATAMSEAVAKTALLSATGIGLKKVAIATAATVVASVGMYEILDKVIFADVNNSADRGRLSAEIGVSL